MPSFLFWKRQSLPQYILRDVANWPYRACVTAEHIICRNRRLCLHHTGHQITMYQGFRNWFSTKCNILIIGWTNEKSLRKSSICSVTLRWLILLFFFFITSCLCTHLKRHSNHSSELKGNYFFEKKMPSVLSRSLFNLILIYLFHRTITMPILLFVCLILYGPSTICQLCKDGSSWVEPVLN